MKTARRQGIDRGPTWVYLIADEDCRDLYVGVTNQLSHRLRTHRREKPWWSEAAYVHAYLYDSRAEALAWEASFIADGTPYNVDRPRPRPATTSRHPFESALMSEQFIVGEDI